MVKRRKEKAGRRIFTQGRRWLLPALGMCAVGGVIWLGVWPRFDERPRERDLPRSAAVAARPPTPPVLPPAAPEQPVRTERPPASASSEKSRDAVAVPQPDRTEKLAMLTVPKPPVRPQGMPAWLRYAVAPPPVNGRPMIAIVLDDLGVDRARTERAIRLPGPLTLSFMTYARDLGTLTGAAHRAGHELLLHVPMEAINPHEDMGPKGLRVSQSREEILDELRWGLGRFEGYVGINNHMGSRFTQDAGKMRIVEEELRARGLLFLDSRTSAETRAEAVAQALGLPHAARDVFLDNEDSVRAVAAQLAETERIARRRGAAIAIGHAHDGTLAALASWRASLAAKGLVLVPLSTIVRSRSGAAG
jgi:uncharacterized protein